MTQAELEELHERVIAADPVMKLDDDEDDGFAVSVDLFESSGSQCFSLDLIDGPQAIASRTQPVDPPKNIVACEPLFETLERLKQNPVFAMSLASKELFHSNFLAWVLDALQRDSMPGFLRAIGVETAPHDRCVILRESHSFDLAFEVGDSDLVVIENKFKSIPRVSQLHDYSAEAKKLAGGRTPHLVLLSPTMPHWLDRCEPWKHLSYEALTSVLREVGEMQRDGFIRELLARYCDMVKLLLDLRDLCCTRADPRFFPCPSYGLLRAHRLHDLIFKWRFDELAAAIEETLAEHVYGGTPEAFAQGGAPDDSVLVSTGFTNGTAIVDLYVYAQEWERTAAADQVPLLGIQLQHNMLRFVIRNVAADHAAKFLQSGPFAQMLNQVKESVTITEPKRAEKAENRYGAWFRYRKIVIDETSELEIGPLVDLMLLGLKELRSASAKAAPSIQAGG